MKYHLETKFANYNSETGALIRNLERGCSYMYKIFVFHNQLIGQGFFQFSINFLRCINLILILPFLKIHNVAILRKLSFCKESRKCLYLSIDIGKKYIATLFEITGEAAPTFFVSQVLFETHISLSKNNCNFQQPPLGVLRNLCNITKLKFYSN